MEKREIVRQTGVGCPICGNELDEKTLKWLDEETGRFPGDEWKDWEKQVKHLAVLRVIIELIYGQLFADDDEADVAGRCLGDAFVEIRRLRMGMGLSVLPTDEEG